MRGAPRSTAPKARRRAPGVRSFPRAVPRQDSRAKTPRRVRAPGSRFASLRPLRASQPTTRLLEPRVTDPRRPAIRERQRARVERALVLWWNLCGRPRAPGHVPRERISSSPRSVLRFKSCGSRRTEWKFHTADCAPGWWSPSGNAQALLTLEKAPLRAQLPDARGAPRPTDRRVRLPPPRRRGWTLGYLLRLPRRQPEVRGRHLRGQRRVPPRAHGIRHPTLHRHQGPARPLLPGAPAAGQARAGARPGVLDQVHGAVQPLRRDRRRPRRPRAP